MGNPYSDARTPRKDRPSMDTSSSTQATAVTTDNAAQGRKQSKAPPVESVSQLLHAVYTGTFKRSTLKKAELVAMRATPKLDDSEAGNLLNLASSDHTLDKTRRLILLIFELDVSPVISQVREFIGKALRRHPAFELKLLRGVLENHPEGVTEERAIRALASQDYASLRWTKESEPMKKGHLEKCKENAVCCLALWFWMTRGTSIERILHYLQAYLWKFVTQRYKTDAGKLRVLTSTRDPAAALIACALLEKQVLQHSRQADAARSAEERAVAQAQELQKKLDDTGTRLKETQTEAERLTKKLEDERQARSDERAHLKDEYEQLRGRVLRRLKDELSLLDEGLHALRREPPKVHVMIDHAERAIDGLKREMERLRGE